MAAAGSGAGSSAHLLNVVGAGAGGINEARTKLEPSSVTFALARVPLGSGTFARDKIVLLHVNPDSCPAIKRGRINSRKGDVRKALGEVHAELVLSDVEEVNLDGVLEALCKVIAADHTLGGGVSIAKMKADYEEMLIKNAAAASSSKDGVALTRKTAAELGTVKSEQALKAVREDMGPFNWCLFTSEFEFVNAGSLSVPEMSKWLAEDAFYFGLVRLGFGTGRFRRTKWVFVVWSGPKVPHVKRARAAAARASLKSKLGPASIDIEAAAAEDITLPIIIDKVKRAAVVDGDASSSTEDPYSVENFMKALQEEAAANAAFFGDSGLSMEGGGHATADELLRRLRTPGSNTNWVAFTVNV